MMRAYKSHWTATHEQMGGPIYHVCMSLCVSVSVCLSACLSANMKAWQSVRLASLTLCIPFSVPRPAVDPVCVCLRCVCLSVCLLK